MIVAVHILRGARADERRNHSVGRIVRVGARLCAQRGHRQGLNVIVGIVGVAELRQGCPPAVRGGVQLLQ